MNKEEKKVKQAVRNNSYFLKPMLIFHILKELIPEIGIKFYFLRKEYGHG